MKKSCANFLVFNLIISILAFSFIINIEFVGLVSDDKLKDYYAYCQAFIFPQEEDFGITAVEAMAAGRPVIAYRAGGALETIKEGVTGLFFEEQTPGHLIKTLKRFN